MTQSSLDKYLLVFSSFQDAARLTTDRNTRPVPLLFQVGELRSPCVTPSR